MKRLLSFIAFLVIISVVAIVWWKHGTLPADSNNNTAQIFVIYKGEGMRQISNDLKSKGLIKDPIVFFLLTKKLGLDTKVQAGDFRLNPSMSAYDIAQNLTHGTLDIWVTVPEGNRAAEIADALEKSIPTYDDSWRTVLAANEGYLFPDTYLIPREATIDQIITLMRNNFDTKYAGLPVQKSTNRTENEIVIIASLIEREAKFADDRPMVASVITNRLDIGMPVQIDASVQYILGYQPSEKTWWKKNLTFADLRINSPYNTYLNAALPPAPIANPGSAALEAALNPAKTDYIYYVSDSSGHLHFAATLEQHNQNVSKYIR